MKREKNLLELPVFFSLLKLFAQVSLWKLYLYCFIEIFKNFFLLQVKAVIFKKKYPVSNVEAPLDTLIPFRSEFVKIYLDFVAFWIRSQGFILGAFGKRALPLVKDFIYSVVKIYQSGAEVYKRNMSTTKRPRYYGNIHFIIIHLFDPHLLCVPSLHIMLLINTYIKFNFEIKTLGAGGGAVQGAYDFDALQNAVFRRAVQISDSVLFVKQHSVNCIAAAMYAMTVLEKELFPPEEAERFINAFFKDYDFIKAEDAPALRSYISGLYKTFLARGARFDAASWYTPLLEFLRFLQT